MTGETPPLSPLREDLELLAAPRQEDGSPVWMLTDPVRHQFFRIGWPEFEILSRWRLGEAAAIVAAVNRQTTLKITPDQVQRVERFLKTNQLLQQRAAAFRHDAASKKQGFFPFLLSILYQRLPLCRPDSFLDATLPLARLWFVPGFWRIIFFLGLLGGYLTLGQWEQFLQTFLSFYSLEGMVYFAGALTLVKAGHELAHAYTAKRFGLKVPVMGVAFILFWPILYTDTTDGWRLPSKKQRLQIGIAGVAFELAVAVFATLCWHLLPLGPWKGVMFMLASSTWIMSLTVNLNPFMRFDGYYLLSDLLDTPNLQQRSFALGRWFLRRLILGIDLPCPENLPGRRRAILITYGYATWVYRLVLYSGIALLVYHFFFKALGILLFAAEAGMLICLPIIRELKAWAGICSQLRMNLRILLSAAILFSLVAAFFYPWNSAIEIPALSRSANFSRIFATQEGRIRESLLAEGRKVEKGEILLIIDSPAIVQQKKQAGLEVELLETQLKRIGFSADHAEQIPIVEQRLVEALTTLAGAREREQRLQIIAPITGIVADVADSLVPGRWVKETDQLASVIDPEKIVIEGYVHERDFRRLSPGAPGKFYPSDSELPPLAVEVKRIAASHTTELEEPYLASVYGGDLPARAEEDGALILQQAVYKVEMEPLSPLIGGRILRGTVIIQGEPVSIAARVRRSIQAVLIRESGF